MDERQFRNTVKKKAALISLYFGIFMLISKFGAFIITDSAAILSDALESIVHIMATVMLLFSIIVSAKPADEDHLYGHGQIEYFSSGVEGFLIILAAITIFYTSIYDIIRGPQLNSIDIGTIIIAVAGVINLFLGFYLIRMGKKTNSLALIADGKHVLTDSYTSIGVVAGLVLVLITGIQLLDPVFAIIIAINIVVTGIKLIRESAGLLMHKTDPELLDSIVKILQEMKKNYWIDIHQLRFWKSSDKVFVDLHLILPFYFTVEQSHIQDAEIKARLNEEYGETETVIHMDYCKPNVCKLCNYLECNVRKEVHSINFKFDKDKLIGKPVYDYYN